MRVRVVEMDVEGSPDEVARFLADRALKTGAPQPASPKVTPPPPPPSGPLTVDVAKTALSRHPLKPNHLAMLRTLHAARPGKVRIVELRRKLGLSEQQFRGVMGSFGRRLGQTPGFGPGMEFLGHDSGGYWLRDPAVAALEDLKLV